VGEIFWEERGAKKLAASENGVRIGTGKMGEGPEQIELRLLSDKKEEFRKFVWGGTEAIHSGVEFGLDECGEARALGSPGKFAGFGERGEGEGEAMAEGEGKLERKSRSKDQDGLTNSCLTELDTLCDAGHTKLFATSSGEGSSDRNKTVAVGIIFNHGEDSASTGKATTESAKIMAEGGQRYLAPGAGISGGFHETYRRGEGRRVRVKKGVIGVA
jgi:hypothetical protein